MYSISEEYAERNKEKSNDKNKEKRPPGRPKKTESKDNKQKTITEFLNYNWTSFN